MNYEDTVGAYSESSSKFIAAISHFPSLTSWGGKRFKTPLESKFLSIYANKGTAFGKYVERQVKNAVIGERSIENKWSNRILSGWTQFSSVTGLSGFFSGVKNFQIGDVSNFATWGLGAFVQGYKYGFTAEGIANARKTGALLAGSKHFKDIGLTKKTFQMISGMGLTEISNRARAKATGMFWMSDALRSLRGEKSLWLSRMGSEKFIKQKLRDTMEMSDKDIAFFKKYGMDADLIPLDTPNYNKVISMHESMMRHINTQVHRATQGTTSVRDLPSWMNEGWGKYGTLFYRMAYSGTRNIYRNTLKPLALNNPLPLLRLISMGLGHGTLLWQFKHAAMGTKRNNEHLEGETPSRLLESLMAVESFSLLGSTVDALDPEEGRGLTQEFMPVIATNALNLLTLANKIYDIPFQSKYTKAAKGKAATQAIDRYLKQTVVAYNHWSKIRDNLFDGSRGKEIVRYRQASRIIRQLRNKKKISVDGDYNWNTPLYKAIEREILLGEDDAIGQTTAAELYWVARSELREKIMEESDYLLSFKDADTKARLQIKASINNRLGVIPFSMNSKDGRIKRKQLFEALDDEGKYIIRKAVTDSENRLLYFWRRTKELDSDHRYSRY